MKENAFCSARPSSASSLLAALQSLCSLQRIRLTQDSASNLKDTRDELEIYKATGCRFYAQPFLGSFCPFIGDPIPEGYQLFSLLLIQPFTKHEIAQSIQQHLTERLIAGHKPSI